MSQSILFFRGVRYFIILLTKAVSIQQMETDPLRVITLQSASSDT